MHNTFLTILSAQNPQNQCPHFLHIGHRAFPVHSRRLKTQAAIIFSLKNNFIILKPFTTAHIAFFLSGYKAAIKRQQIVRAGRELYNKPTELYKAMLNGRH